MGREPGRFVLSLDFELHWGVRDKRTVQEYTEHLLGARRAVPAMLSLFREYDIKATWAVVGFLCASHKGDLRRWTPEWRPAYENRALCAYDAIGALGDNEETAPFHYARSLVRTIQDTPGQELGSHTFSHYYCLEKGQSVREFDADCRAMKKVGESLGVAFTSLVLPRNHINPAYHATAAQNGITAYRGEDTAWPDFSLLPAWKRKYKRAQRLADAYVNLSGANSYPLSEVGAGRQAGAPLNVRASAFLRPYVKRLQFLEPLRLKRVQDSLSHAAKQGEVYHLWWHPHNFGADVEKNLHGLENILQCFSTLREQYGMRSDNMASIVDAVVKL